MSFRTTKARQKIVGLLRAAPDKTLDYDQVQEGTEGIETTIVDEALADMVAAGEAREKDGSYTLLELKHEPTAPSTAAKIRRQQEIDAGIPESAREAKAVNTDLDAMVLACVRILRESSTAIGVHTIQATLPGQPPVAEVQRALRSGIAIGSIVKIGRGKAATYKSAAKLIPAQQSAFASAAGTSAHQPSGDPAMPKNSDVKEAVKLALQPGEALKLAALVTKCKGSTAYKVKGALTELIDAGEVAVVGKGRSCRYGLPGAHSAATTPTSPKRNASSAVGKELADMADKAQQAFEAFIRGCLSKEQLKQLEALQMNRDNARRLAAEFGAR